MIFVGGILWGAWVWCRYGVDCVVCRSIFLSMCFRRFLIVCLEVISRCVSFCGGGHSRECLGCISPVRFRGGCCRGSWLFGLSVG